jgi:hypothetical protein
MAFLGRAWKRERRERSVIWMSLGGDRGYNLAQRAEIWIEKDLPMFPSQPSSPNHQIHPVKPHSFCCSPTALLES